MPTPDAPFTAIRESPFDDRLPPPKAFLRRRRQRRPDLAAEQALRVGACKYINIKPGSVGGLSNAIAIHDIARDAGVPVWVGGMLESAVGGAICIELATLGNFTYPGDLLPSSRFYVQDLAEPPTELTDRKTFVPYTGPLPAPDPTRLEKLTVRSKTVVPA